MKKRIKVVTNQKEFKKALKKVKKNEVIVLDEGRPTKKEIDEWANQKVVIECNMHQAGDLMDLLFMADGGPFDGYFQNTIKLNKMTKAYSFWLNKMVSIVCPEIEEAKKKYGRMEKHKRVDRNKK
jgi:hypothetical protein